ncbi:MAG: hypothetical protein IJ567_10175 [Lachnospiraceae bacterium]|nr:hypothetical protein [Lachnospiraceae bacterium]
MAKDTSEVLASYLQILSNLIYAAERLSESEMAMLISSLNRWVTKKDISVNRSYGVGKIVQMEWGNNFSPELSYKHPAVIIEEWVEHQKLIQAYEKEQEKNKALQEAYDKLLEENKMLKSADTNDAAPKNKKSEETN